MGECEMAKRRPSARDSEPHVISLTADRSFAARHRRHRGRTCAQRLASGALAIYLDVRFSAFMASRGKPPTLLGLVRLYYGEDSQRKLRFYTGGQQTTLRK